MPTSPTTTTTTLLPLPIQITRGNSRRRRLTIKKPLPPITPYQQQGGEGDTYLRLPSPVGMGGLRFSPALGSFGDRERAASSPHQPATPTTSHAPNSPHSAHPHSPPFSSISHTPNPPNPSWKPSEKVRSLLGIEEGTLAYAQVALSTLLSRLPPTNPTGEGQEGEAELAKRREVMQGCLYWKGEVGRLS